MITDTGVLRPLPFFPLQFPVTKLGEQHIPVEPAASNIAAETGFNWTALTTIWAHGDYRCLFTSKGGFIQACWLAVLLLRMSGVVLLIWSFRTVIWRVDCPPKMGLKAHCDLTSGSLQIIQLLRHQRLFMVRLTSGTLTPQAPINLCVKNRPLCFTLSPG